jgi:ankyrin repeat protein
LALCTSEIPKNNWNLVFHLIVKNSQCEVIHFLVAYFHMDVRKFSPVDGNTPLHWAACGRIRAISTLLSLGADVNSINRQGATPLILAATCGQVEAVRILLRHGANTSIATSVEQYTVWHIAAQRGFVDILQELIANYQAGGSATGFLAVDAEGNTPLHWTCRQCDALSAILALEGVDLELANQNGETPLLLVARFGVSDAVRLLLQLGADMQRVTREGDTAVHVAVRCNHVHVVRELVSHPACPIETTNNAGLTPLLLACTHCTGAVPILLSCGADVTRRTRSDNETALHLAVRQGEAVVVEELLARCPYVDSLMVENVNGIHPYQLAVNLRSSSIEELNLKSGSVWYMNKAAQRLRVLDLLEAAMKGGLNWRRKRNYAMFLSGVLHSEQLLLSVPAGRKAIEEVFKGQDMRMLIGKFI